MRQLLIAFILIMTLLEPKLFAETDMKEPFTNRLIHEKSPYLLQHAHNPVD